MDKNYKVVFAKKSCVELWEDEIPEVGENQVLIETELSQISTGTELTMLEANISEDSAWNKDIEFPFFPGYSNVGKVIKIGKGVEESWLGKRVLAGSPHQKYTVREVNDWMVIIPDEIESEEAVFGSLAPVAMASIRVSDIRSGDTVVVFGAGLVGQLVARFAKLAGASNVFVTDVSDYRLSMLPDEPSFIKVNTMQEDIVQALHAYGKKELARVVFETTSVPSLVEKELFCLQNLGRLIITSSPKGKSYIDFEYCSRHGLTIIGAHNHAVHTPVKTARDPWTIREDKLYFLDLLSKKEISLKNMITHRSSYKNAADMYQMLMKDRTQAMAVLLYWQE